MTASSRPVGTLCIVLHSHLPWVAHAGTWPVGEEWLHQAWAASYLPLVAMLDRLASEGRRDLLTLGVTPVLAAQLDDPYCLSEFHAWLAMWQGRAHGLASRSEEHLRRTGERESLAAAAALDGFERRWRHGASPVLRTLVDDGVVEILGGPATHPFTPLLEERVARTQLTVGLDDSVLRLGGRPAGIWAPECGYRPGLESMYADAGVERFMVDGPTLIRGRADRAATADAWTVGDSDVVVFGRDLDVSYRVWSPRRGYPAGRWYRDFHTFDHDSGLHPARVTGLSVGPAAKAPYDPAPAAAAVDRDARDFVTVVVDRMRELRSRRDGREPVVVVAYDTELFGHWWHEGPAWLEQVLRLMPSAGVRLASLGGAVAAGALAGRVHLPAGSWGSGKDWRVWDGAAVTDLNASSADVQSRLLKVVDAAVRADQGTARSAGLDQLAREAFLVTSSDWAFMVSKGSAAGYARERAAAHTARFHTLASLVEAHGLGDPAVIDLTGRWRRMDGLFGHLDARLLSRAWSPAVPRPPDRSDLD